MLTSEGIRIAAATIWSAARRDAAFESARSFRVSTTGDEPARGPDFASAPCESRCAISNARMERSGVGQSIALVAS